MLSYSKRLADRVATLEEEAARLRDERDALRAENGVIGEHVFGLQKENGMLHNMGLTTMMEKAQLAKQAQGAGQDLAQLGETMAQQEARIEGLVAEGGQLRALIEALRGEKAQLEHTVNGLKATVDTVHVDLKKHVAREQGLENEGMGLKRQLEQLQAEKGRLDEVASGQHVEIAKLQQVVKELQAEKARSHALALKLDTADREIARCYKEKAELDQMVSTLHVEAANMKTQRDSAMAELPHLQASLQSEGVRANDLHGQVVQLQQFLHQLKQDNGRMYEEARSLRLALEKAQQDNCQKDDAARRLMAETSRLRQALDGLSAGRAEAESQLSAAAGEKGLLRAHFEQVAAEKEQLLLRVQQAAAENAALRSRLVGLETMVQGSQDETAALQQRLQVLSEEKETLEDRLLQLQLPPQRRPGAQHPTSLQGQPLTGASSGMAL